MSNDAQEHCRKIDMVTVKGSAVPMPIYTYDTFQDQTFPELQTPKFSDLSLQEVLAQVADEYESHTTWKVDEDLVQLRRLATPEFQSVFREGVDCYLGGNWNKARMTLEKADEMMKSNGNRNGDGPSRTILRYMKARGWQVPEDWKGYRPLTSK